MSLHVFAGANGRQKRAPNTALPAKPHRHVAKRCADGVKRKRYTKLFGGGRSHANSRIVDLEATRIVLKVQSLEDEKKG